MPEQEKGHELKGVSCATCVTNSSFPWFPLGMVGASIEKVEFVVKPRKNNVNWLESALNSALPNSRGFGDER